MNLGHLDNELSSKVIRIFIAAFSFLCIVNMIGLTLRSSHQLMFSMFAIILFSLLLKNIWLTLFVWWTCLLFCMSRFETGGVYVTNLFYGCVLYYMTKLVYKKEHIDFFIKILLWVVVANIAYSITQVMIMDYGKSWDFIYQKSEYFYFLNFDGASAPNGFMGNSGVTSMLYAFAIPLIATRGKGSIFVALSLFFPLYILHSSISTMAGIIGLLFVLYFKMKRWIWASMVGVLSIFAILFLMYCDTPGKERFPIWKVSMQDAVKHPIRGWGLDSYRKFTEKKDFKYVSENRSNSHWDNPHNLLISLFFEWGIIAWILLGGYIRRSIQMFRYSNKTKNTIALAGFILVFFIVSMGNFPIFLARMCAFIIPAFALYEVSTT